MWVKNQTSSSSTLRPERRAEVRDWLAIVRDCLDEIERVLRAPTAPA